MLTSLHLHPFQIGLFSSTVATFVAVSYPSLKQDPNVVTQSLLAQISQQLSSANANGSIPPTTLSTQSPFSPSASVVFVNSVWFLSLVLSLTCALMATLLQQWARRYLQIVRQNHPPHIQAHIREYFYQGARNFRIFGLVELLPFLLIVSVLLFFAGLVVFAFLGNHTVAKFTLAIVGFCFLSYIIFTMMPLVFHDCPYWTPLTSVLWFTSRIIGLGFYWVRDRGATYLHDHWGLLKSRVKLYRETHEKKAKLWSEDMVSQLEDSAKRISMEIYTKALAWTLQQLGKDHELEEFVAGIPDLYAYLDFVTTTGIRHVEGDIQPSHVQQKLQSFSISQLNIRRILAYLPGPMSFDEPLSRSILLLAQRAFFGNLSKHDQHKRIQTCLRALYLIPGAIRDSLAPYAAVEYYCLYSTGLLNSQESLEVIEELWDTQNADVALSVRCAAAVVAAFMIAPPRSALDGLVSVNLAFIGDNNTGKRFLAKRLRVSSTADEDVAPEIHPNSDTARLQNIVRFLADIKVPLWYVSNTEWPSHNPNSIRREREALSEPRFTTEYRDGFGLFDPKGDRASPAFIPAAQQDLIILTLDILARHSVADAAPLQCEAFHDAYMELVQDMAVEAQSHSWTPAQTQSPADIEAQVHSPGFIQLIRRTLEPVFQALPVPQNVTPYDNRAPSLPRQVSDDITPYDDHAVHQQNILGDYKTL
jgi:hypothetical protein